MLGGLLFAIWHIIIIIRLCNLSSHNRIIRIIGLLQNINNCWQLTLLFTENNNFVACISKQIFNIIYIFSQIHNYTISNKYVISNKAYY